VRRRSRHSSKHKKKSSSSKKGEESDDDDDDDDDDAGGALSPRGNNADNEGPPLKLHVFDLKRAAWNVTDVSGPLGGTFVRCCDSSYHYCC
jgi:hypothetical protein